jgi:hypothetical protein
MGLLDLAIDPKLAWALANRDRFPVDVNTADRELLLRVPGLGVKTIDKLLRLRAVSVRSASKTSLASRGRLKSAAPSSSLATGARSSSPMRKSERACGPSRSNSISLHDQRQSPAHTDVRRLAR